MRTYLNQVPKCTVVSRGYVFYIRIPIQQCAGRVMAGFGTEGECSVMCCYIDLSVMLWGHYGTCATACMDLAVSVARVVTERIFCVRRTRKIKAHVFFSA